MADDDKSKDTKDDVTEDDRDTDTDPDKSTTETEGEKKWKALARKHEQRAKENAEKAKKFDELEQSNKSESQKAADRISQLESELATANGRVARMTVALRKGLTEVQAKRLVGDTEEDLEKDADELLESFGGKKDDGDTDAKDTKQRDRRPKERLRPGATPSGGEEDEMDPKKLADQVSSTSF